MKEDVSNLFGKITEESSGLGSLLSKIPGLSGYMERSRRREADQLLRETIASRLEGSRLKLGGVHQELSRDIIKAIDFAEPLGRADTKLMGLVGKIKDAPTGYAGFFDAVKVKEEDLAQIYTFDEQLLGHADQIESAVAALHKAVVENGDVGGNIRALDAAAQEANDVFAKRGELLAGVA